MSPRVNKVNMLRNRWVLGIALSIVALAAALHLYFIREGSGAHLLWNDDKVYLIIKVGRLGYRMSYLRYLPEPVLERLYYVPPPDVKNDYSVIFVITPETVQRFDFETIGLSCGHPMGRSIYCGSNRGLLKWTASTFESASPEDAKKLVAINFPSNYDNINGWSERWDLSAGTTVINLGGKKVVLVRTGLQSSEIAIDLLRPGQPAERIWYLNERTHVVTKAEYQQAFESR